MFLNFLQVNSNSEIRECSGDLMGKHHRNDEQVAVELCTDKLSKFSDIEMPYLRLSGEFFIEEYIYIYIYRFLIRVLSCRY